MTCGERRTPIAIYFLFRKEQLPFAIVSQHDHPTNL
jgi:hypothetical protein